MELQKIVDKLNLDVKVGMNNLNVEVENAYASDLLSDVLARCHERYNKR